MEGNAKTMRSIWFFVGLMLLVMGALVLAAAVVQLFGGRPGGTVFAASRPGLWWGALMIASGAAFLIGDRRSRHG